MRLKSSYDVYIFDCDGVILDSNPLKINAMGKALDQVKASKSERECCLDYFANNFGRSRFHHINYFVNNLLAKDIDKESCTQVLLESYSSQCKQLYIESDKTDGILEFLSSINGKKYVASGSEQQELREVFSQKQLSHFFDGIFGSPTKKVKLVSQICHQNPEKNIVMFGDAISDLQAANANGIDFIGYTPYSSAKSRLISDCKYYGYKIINNWSEIC